MVAEWADVAGDPGGAAGQGGVLAGDGVGGDGAAAFGQRPVVQRRAEGGRVLTTEGGAGQGVGGKGGAAAGPQFGLPGAVDVALQQGRGGAAPGDSDLLPGAGADDAAGGLGRVGGLVQLAGGGAEGEQHGRAGVPPGWAVARVKLFQSEGLAPSGDWAERTWGVVYP